MPRDPHAAAPASDAAGVGASPPGDAAAGAPRRFLGRLELRELIAHTERSMTWRVVEPARGATWLIVLPRHQPETPDARARWLADARHAARLTHPGLRPVVEVGVEEDWPYIAHDAPAGWTSLGERLRDGAIDAAAAVALLVPALDALAAVHDADIVHGDLHPHALAIGPDGRPAWLGLGLGAALVDDPFAGGGARRALAREVARDVAAVGLMLRHAVGGRPALAEPVPMQVLDRIAPLGGEAVGAFVGDGVSVPPALRAIAERASHRQPRLRYATARAMQRALEGWRLAQADPRHGALALLGERLRRFGALPAPPAGLTRLAAASSSTEHLRDIAERAVGEPALALELLRRANLAVGHGGLGGGSVLSASRALQLVGTDGLRDAALALPAWPGTLDDVQAEALLARVARVKRAGALAPGLLPAGYDPTVAMAVAQLQRLGPLLVAHHFPAEAAQIARLCAAPPPSEAPAGAATLDEAAAALTVLGVDVDALAQAVLRRWGFDDDVLPLLRPVDADALVPTTVVRDADAQRLRAAASAAYELALAEEQAMPARRRALEAIEQRYARVLGVDLERLWAVLDGRDGDETAAASRHAATTTIPGLRPGPAALARTGAFGSPARA